MKLTDYEGTVNDNVSAYVELKALIGLYQILEKDPALLPFDIQHDILTIGTDDILYRYYDGQRECIIYNDGTILDDNFCETLGFVDLEER